MDLEVATNPVTLTGYLWVRRYMMDFKVATNQVTDGGYLRVGTYTMDLEVLLLPYNQVT